MKTEICIFSARCPARPLSSHRLEFVETRVLDFYSQGSLCQRITSKRDIDKNYSYTNMRLVFQGKDKPSVRLDVCKNMIQKFQTFDIIDNGFDNFGILEITQANALPVLKYHDYIFQIYSKAACKFKIFYDVVINKDYENVKFTLLKRLSNDIKNNTVSLMSFYTDDDLPPPYYEKD